VGIKPILGFKEEVVAVYSESPLHFQNLRKLENRDALALGSLKMKPLQLLKKWKIHMKDSFQRTEKGNPSNDSKDIEFDLYFESCTPPYEYSTYRGDQYEQPGSLKGKIKIEEKTIIFNGSGIRDHSWETRNMLNLKEWYALMGRFGSGDAVNFAYFKIDGKILYEGWWKTDTYCEIRDIQVAPVFSGDILGELHTEIETSKGELVIDSQLISFVSLFIGNEQKKIEMIETLVRLDCGMGD